MKLIDILACELKVWPQGFGNAVGQSTSGRLHPVNGRVNHTVEAFTMSCDWASAVVTREEWQAAVEALKAPAVDWSKAPEWADRVVVGPQSESEYWANDSRRVRLDGEFDLMNKIHIHDNWQVLERRPAPTWPSEGVLPPVGTVCELWKSGAKGVHVEIIAHFKANSEMVAAYVPVSGSRYVGQAVYHCFRPIRTAEQIAAEEKEKALDEMAGCISFLYAGQTARRAIAKQLYDAGYRKQ